MDDHVETHYPPQQTRMFAPAPVGDDIQEGDLCLEEPPAPKAKPFSSSQLEPRETSRANECQPEERPKQDSRSSSRLIGREIDADADAPTQMEFADIRCSPVLARNYDGIDHKRPMESSTYRPLQNTPISSYLR